MNSTTDEQIAWVLDRHGFTWEDFRETFGLHPRAFVKYASDDMAALYCDGDGGVALLYVSEEDEDELTVEPLDCNWFTLDFGIFENARDKLSEAYHNEHTT